MSRSTVLDMMVLNIWHGGRLDKFWDGSEFVPVQPHGFEEQNQAELLEFLAQERPDVLFMVETYGLGERVEEALNRDFPGDGRRFRGIRISQDPEQPPHRDNLWLFTWLPVEEIYPLVDVRPVTPHHFGGVRLGLPGGGHIHAFTVWLSHRENAWTGVNRAAMERALGRTAPDTERGLISADEPERLEMARVILQELIPQCVSDDAPVLLGGDFNTQSPLDWSDGQRGAPRHEGLSLPWPVLQMFHDEGFDDVFRVAHPDAGRHPGRTWAPAFSFTYVPIRLDYLLAKGRVDVLASSTRTRRLPAHQESPLDELYPFYSDHAAVVSRIRFPDDHSECQPPHPAVDEPEIDGWPEVPEEPAGLRVPAAKLFAWASGSDAGRPAQLAVDGSLRTSWLSRREPFPPAPFPHHLTVDLGEVVALNAVRYQPPIDGFWGIILRYAYEVSDDGSEFREVARGLWERDSLPKDVLLDDVECRYVRLVAFSGVGGCAAVAELVAYRSDETERILGLSRHPAVVPPAPRPAPRRRR